MFWESFIIRNIRILLLAKFNWFLPPISLKISSLHMIWKPLNQFCCSLLSNKCFESLLSSGTSGFCCWQSLIDFYQQYTQKFRPCTPPESLWNNFVLAHGFKLLFWQHTQNDAAVANSHNVPLGSFLSKVVVHDLSRIKKYLFLK